eukprot:4734048-Pyramimonas_sp.AAC.1
MQGVAPAEVMLLAALWEAEMARVDRPGPALKRCGKLSRQRCKGLIDGRLHISHKYTIGHGITLDTEIIERVEGA